MVERKTPNLAGVGKPKKSAVEGATKKKSDSVASDEQKKSKLQDELDEGILDEEEASGSSKKWIFIIAAVVVSVLLVFILMLTLSSRGKNEPVVEQPVQQPQQQVQQQPQVQQPSQQPQTQQPTQQPSFGTQDFTQNTNMNAGSVLTNPDEFVEDIYGLSTRVNYTVSKIGNAADFVSYEKKRGTWGGGLELYWLEATYKGNKYVIQVPFEYYKELDEVGIVPVKMEVVTVPGSAEGETLTIITYMQLDADTLKTILKTQKK